MNLDIYRELQVQLTQLEASKGLAIDSSRKRAPSSCFWHNVSHQISLLTGCSYQSYRNMPLCALNVRLYNFLREKKSLLVWRFSYK